MSRNGVRQRGRQPVDRREQHDLGGDARQPRACRSRERRCRACSNGCSRRRRWRRGSTGSPPRPPPRARGCREGAAGGPAPAAAAAAGVTIRLASAVEAAITASPVRSQGIAGRSPKASSSGAADDAGGQESDRAGHPDACVVEAAAGAHRGQRQVVDARHQGRAGHGVQADQHGEHRPPQGGAGRHQRIGRGQCEAAGHDQAPGAQPPVDQAQEGCGRHDPDGDGKRQQRADHPRIEPERVQPDRHERHRDADLHEHHRVEQRQPPGIRLGGRGRTGLHGHRRRERGQEADVGSVKPSLNESCQPVVRERKAAFAANLLTDVSEDAFVCRVPVH